MKNKKYTLKYVGKLPIVLFIILYYIPAIFIMVIISQNEQNDIWVTIMDCLVFGLLFLWFLLALFIHPVSIKNAQTINITNLAYPFRERLNIKDITRIVPHEVPVVFGKIKCLTLYTDHIIKNIFITDIGDFCTECVKINPKIEVTN